jgi:hypothetical protein
MFSKSFYKTIVRQHLELPQAMAATMFGPKGEDYNLGLIQPKSLGIVWGKLSKIG